MDCTLIEDRLIGFHFGEVAGGERAAVEAHLVECASCLRAFLALKRAMESEEHLPRPSAKARERLRAAVASELASRRRRWVVRGLAVAAIALLVAGALDLAARRRAIGPAPLPAVDSALAEPASLHVL